MNLVLALSRCRSSSSLLGKAGLLSPTWRPPSSFGTSWRSTSCCMFFNLIPLPPLDGAAVLAGLLPDVAPVHLRTLSSATVCSCSSSCLLSGSLGVVMRAGLSPRPSAWADTLQRHGGGVSAERGHLRYRIALPEFEGPLDLLLHLCKTHELDIVNIPIAFVTEKYLEYLEIDAVDVGRRRGRLPGHGGDARLPQVARAGPDAPSRSTAAGEEDEPELDPREELIRRLLEYQKYKDAAEKLGGRPIEGRTVFGRGVPHRTTRPTRAVRRAVGLEADRGVRADPGEGGQGPTIHDVVVDRVSIGDRIDQLIDRLEAGGGSFRFETLLRSALPEAELRHQVVVTLLAILELARLKVVRVLQSPRRRDAVHHAGGRRDARGARRRRCRRRQQSGPSRRSPTKQPRATDETPARARARRVGRALEEMLAEIGRPPRSARTRTLESRRRRPSAEKSAPRPRGAEEKPRRGWPNVRRRPNRMARACQRSREGDRRVPTWRPPPVRRWASMCSTAPSPTRRSGRRRPSPRTSWDGPTNVGTEDELAELATASVSSVEEDAVLADAVVAARQ